MKNSENIVTLSTIINLAEYGKDGNAPPKGASYKFKVKNIEYTVTVEKMTGREICEMAGLIPPENYRLDMKIKGEYKEVKLSDVISFIEPGIEKFTYISRDQTEG